MEEPPFEEEKEIDTSFTVQVKTYVISKQLLKLLQMYDCSGYNIIYV